MDYFVSYAGEIILDNGIFHQPFPQIYTVLVDAKTVEDAVLAAAAEYGLERKYWAFPSEWFYEIEDVLPMQPTQRVVLRSAR